MNVYNVNDWVETKYGLGIIKKIWQLNDIVTVFEIKHLRDDKIRNVFYGEINYIVHRG